MRLLIPGNDKMGEKVLIFNLPPKLTCTPTDWCLHGKEGKPACYALRNRFLWDNAIKGAMKRYRASKRDDFVEKIVQQIKGGNKKFIKFHSSGDFYSEEYIGRVMEIARNCPDVLFRTTTRRRDLVEILQELNSLPNFIVRESLDPTRLKPKMGLPFAALSYLDIAKEKYVYKCKDNCTICQHYCWQNRCDVCFDER